MKVLAPEGWAADDWRASGFVYVCGAGFFFLFMYFLVGWLILDRRNLNVITVREQDPVAQPKRGK